MVIPDELDALLRRVASLEEQVEILQRGANGEAIAQALAEALTPISQTFERRLDSLLPMNEAQMKLLEEAKEERIRRSEGERIRAAAAAETQRQREIVEKQIDNRRSFWLKAAAIAVGGLTPIGTAIAAYFALLKH